MKLETKRVKLIAWFNNHPQPFNCKGCGGFHRAILEFHFPDKSKDISILEMIEHGLTIRQAQTKMKGGKIMCSNCHKKLHWDEKIT